MFGALLALEDVVARNAPVGPGDVRRTKNALARSGFLAQDGFAGSNFPSEGMFAGLKSFQRANGLRADGEIDRYCDRFNEQQRRDLNVARGKARAIRDNRVDVLLERIKNRKDNLVALSKAGVFQYAYP